MNSEDFFNQVRTSYMSQIPFVIYKHPDSNKIKGVYQNNSELHFIKNFSESGFVFAPFDGLNKSVIFPIDLTNFIETNFETANNNNEIESFINSDDSIEMQSHLELVEAGIESIKKDKFDKVVLSRVQKIKNSKERPIELFKKLINKYPEAFVYCWYHPKVGLWLGATPECFLFLEGKQLSTAALAGTQKYVNSLDVNWGEKEKEEQRIVSKFIKESLSDYLESIEIKKPKTIKAGSLLHIQSELRGKIISKENLGNVIKALHPTPAVCGYPKQKAKQFILQNEGYNREFYTGFLGELNLTTKIKRNASRRNVENNAYIAIKKSSKLYVNLRCLQIKNNEVLIYVGGGITKDSIPLNEWHETVHKSETMKRVLR